MSILKCDLREGDSLQRGLIRRRHQTATAALRVVPSPNHGPLFASLALGMFGGSVWRVTKASSAYGLLSEHSAGKGVRVGEKGEEGTVSQHSGRGSQTWHPGHLGLENKLSRLYYFPFSRGFSSH